jgi:hypothetical protein
MEIEIEIEMEMACGLSHIHKIYFEAQLNLISRVVVRYSNGSIMSLRRESWPD